MIRYQLACDGGHGFESWFRDSHAFDEQADENLISCPVCQSTRVGKSIMAPAVVSRVAPIPREILAPARTNETTSVDLAAAALRVRMKALREAILKDTQDVGAAFPEEARRIQDGKAPARQIRGVATLAEARTLVEEGIAVLPIPTFPDELN